MLKMYDQRRCCICEADLVQHSLQITRMHKTYHVKHGSDKNKISGRLLHWKAVS
jgi:hypothetical protein